jgi:hypothetical protein|tara:strand:- start:602 stop:790 length:189 start_codon:yes stop_codon:yes gene_type:complete
MSSNYPDSMTAADHAHLDGVPQCEHVLIFQDAFVIDDDTIQVLIYCSECNMQFNYSIEGEMD